MKKVEVSKILKIQVKLGIMSGMWINEIITIDGAYYADTLCFKDDSVYFAQLDEEGHILKA